MKHTQEDKHFAESYINLLLCLAQQRLDKEKVEELGDPVH